MTTIETIRIVRRTARDVAGAALKSYRMAERAGTPSAIRIAAAGCQEAADAWTEAGDEVAAARWQDSADMWNSRLEVAA